MDTGDTKTSSKIEDLQDLIEGSIASEPYELDGFKWCKKSHPDRCAALGISDSTLRRIIRKPPFVSKCRVIDGIKTTLLRVGVPGPKTPYDLAQIMSAIWRKRLKARKTELELERNVLEKKVKNLAAPATLELGEKIEEIERELGRLPTVNTRHEFGCLNGLAEVWPQGMQVEIFEIVLDDWPMFVTGAKLAIDLLASQGQPTVYRYYDYPSIGFIRRFPNIAVDMAVMKYQWAGKEPPAALKALFPKIWPKKFGGKKEP
ncbi:hypothetical protein [Mesorhizobium sp.]|uniref:hypothetical protein n=1 Tax=Mesorhizobium sp. TaxID=1871066 RepID=UPI000FE4B512|nr:hypothetical protein [Mesorhizobium sp.]RWC59481.1 MAG: hypothetical protein EOS29_21870 [Mesorhizobium sp.]RWC60462.1 MAG: hypothetical protein EOS56_14310 [Mesorhizobium sp.]